MKKLLTLAALTAAFTLTGAAQAGTTQAQRGHTARIVHLNLQNQTPAYALTGQTYTQANQAVRSNYPKARYFRGGRAAH